MLLSTVKATFLAVTFLYCFGYVEAGFCYWPGSIQKAHDMTQCSPSNSSGGACCAYGDYCTKKGFCLSSTNFYYYRGACTDSKWTPGICPQLCIAPISGSSQTLQVFSSCDIQKGTWCCSANGPCCNDTFANLDLGALIIPSQVTSTISQTATVAMSTITAPPIQPLPDCPDCAPIGIGVGVPLTVIASLAAAYAIWLYGKLYHPTRGQKSGQTAFSSKSNKGKYDKAKDAAPDEIPLQDIEASA